MLVASRLRHALSTAAFATSQRLFVAAVLVLAIGSVASAEDKPDASIEQRVQALVPSLEKYVDTYMKGFDVPGVAVGIVANDKLIYAKGFGTRSKGGAPVDT